MTYFSIATPVEGEKSLTVMYETGDVISVPSNHPNFDSLIELLNSGKSDDESVKLLINTLHVVGEKMARVSERITVAPWGVFFDGDPLRGELADTIIRLHKQGDDTALKPLVAFMEKASTNPSLDSVEALYKWIRTENLTITDSGDFIGYKGVLVDGDGFRSVHGNGESGRPRGKALVDGVVHEGRIPYPVGAVVEMPRSEVDPKSENYCSVGLHVGTWKYASWFLRAGAQVIIAVQVNPRDVVMAPDDDHEKIRVCRYVILNKQAGKIKDALVADGALTWKKNQLVKISTTQGETRVYAQEDSTAGRDWLDGSTVVHVYDVFPNGRNSKGHFVKGFKPEGLTRDEHGKFVRETPAK